MQENAKRKLVVPVLVVVALAALTLAAVGFAGGERTTAAQPARTTQARTAVSPLLALQRQFVDVVKRVTPSVVQIESQDGLGSGIVYDNAGHIVTNAHVVGNSTTFKVTLANSNKAYTGRLVGTFAMNDLAVIDIDANGLRPARFANSSALQRGDIVMAVGNPLGLQSSVTEGIVSALSRTVSEPNGPAIANLIQTSAPINPGNSGGALVDLQGRVVGIPTLGSAQASGIGFAIPSNVVRDIAGQLIKSGKVTSTGRAYLGVRLGDLLGGGAYVGEVETGGPAAKAGVRAGDVIVSLAGKSIGSAQDLSETLAPLKPGQKVKIGVQRQDGSRATLTITLGEFPSS